MVAVSSTHFIATPSSPTLLGAGIGCPFLLLLLIRIHDGHDVLGKKHERGPEHQTNRAAVERRVVRERPPEIRTARPLHLDPQPLADDHLALLLVLLGHQKISFTKSVGTILERALAVGIQKS